MHKRFIITLGVFLSTTFLCSIFSSTMTFDHLISSSWWEIASAKDYVRNSDFAAMRQKRAECFKDDTKKFKQYNNKIPKHTFCSDPKSIRIATYNVRFWNNVFNTPNQQKVLKNITELNPDVIIMQEFNATPLKNDTWKLQDLLQHFKQAGYIYGGLPTLITIKSTLSDALGTIIFSKYPLKDIYSKRFESSLPHVECLGYTHATLCLEDTTISMYASHLAAEFYPKTLTFAEDVRFEQIRQIMYAMNTDKEKNILLAADFNAVCSEDYQYKVNDTKVWKLINQDYKAYVGCSRPSYARNLLKHSNFKTSFEKLGLSNPNITNWTAMAVDSFYLHQTWQLPLQGSYVYYHSASDHYLVLMDIVL